MKTTFHWKGAPAEDTQQPGESTALGAKPENNHLQVSVCSNPHFCSPPTFEGKNNAPFHATALLPIPHPCPHSFIVFPQGCFCGLAAGNSREASSSAVSLLTSPVWSGFKSVRTAQRRPSQACQEVSDMRHPAHTPFQGSNVSEQGREQMGVNKGLSVSSCLLTL